MRMLVPHPTDVPGVDALRAWYTPGRAAPAGRPWVALCMVSGLDGSTVVDHRSRGLSSPVDQALLLALRSLADTILVGAGTVRAEGYGPSRVPGQRIAVVSRTGRLPFDAPLFTSGNSLVVLPEDAPEVPVASVRAGRGDVDLALALQRLHELHGSRAVQAEGGAILNGALVAADLVDELDLTLSPQVNGGDGARLTAGAPPVAHRMRLAHLVEDEGFLFGRWLRDRRSL